MTQIGIDRAEVGFEHIVNLESSQPCALKKGKKKIAETQISHLSPAAAAETLIGSRRRPHLTKVKQSCPRW